jgi:hypothetical protein
MNSDESASSQEPESLPYRRVDLTPTEWRSVGSYSSLAEWHAAKAVLQRNGVIARMGANPYDDNSTNLLVPITDVFWAAELIRQAGEPKIERSVGFPVAPPPAPPLPGSELKAASTPPPQSADADATTVLDFEPAQTPQEAVPNYGCALAFLWTLLGLVSLILLLLLATYQPT